MKNTICLLITMLMVSVVTPAQFALAAEYQRPPFELKGDLAVAAEFASDREVPLAMFEGMWSDLTIRVYKNYFTGYSRAVHQNDENNIRLLTVSGEYDRGYLKGTWEYQHADQWEDTYHGPYPRVYEGTGTFVSGLIESKTEGIIPANVEGTMNYTHGELDEKSTPSKPIWVNEESSLVFNGRWEGKIKGDVCGGPDVDQYVGKKILTGVIFRDWSGEAKIMHCGLAEGSSPLVWEPVKDNEMIYVSDRLQTSDKGETILEIYTPDSLKENGLGATAGWSYRLGGDVKMADQKGFNPGVGTVVFLHPGQMETKLELVAGRMWANAKSLLLEGTMKIETSQAVAGIKGTNFILGSHDPRVTELVVLEGAVEFTAKADGKTVMVNAGQKVVATEKGMGELESFDPVPLLTEYNNTKEIQSLPTEEDYTAGPAPAGAPDSSEVTARADKSGENSSDDKRSINYVLGVALLAAIAGGVWFVIKKRK